MKRFLQLLLVPVLVGGLILLVSLVPRGSHPCFVPTPQSNAIPGFDVTERPETDIPITEFERITLTNAARISEIDRWAMSAPKIHFATFSSDGHLFAWQNGGEFNITNLLTRENVTSRIDGKEYLTGFAFDDEGNPVVLVGLTNQAFAENATVRLRDIKTNTEIAALSLNKNESFSHIIFSPDARCIAFGSNYAKVRLWDIEKHIEQSSLSADNSVSVVAFSPDGKLLAYGTDGDNDSSSDVVIGIWNLEINQEVLRLSKKHRSSISEVLFSPDGKYLVSGSGDSIRLWDTSTGEEMVQFSGGAATDMVISEDGNILASVRRESEFLRLWDVSTGRLFAVFNAHEPLVFVTFTPDDEMLVAVSETGTVHYFAVKD